MAERVVNGDLSDHLFDQMYSETLKRLLAQTTECSYFIGENICHEKQCLNYTRDPAALSYSGENDYFNYTYNTTLFKKKKKKEFML